MAASRRLPVPESYVASKRIIDRMDILEQLCPGERRADRWPDNASIGTTGATLNAAVDEIERLRHVLRIAETWLARHDWHVTNATDLRAAIDHYRNPTTTCKHPGTLHTHDYLLRGDDGRTWVSITGTTDWTTDTIHAALLDYARWPDAPLRPGNYHIITHCHGNQIDTHPTTIE